LDAQTSELAADLDRAAVTRAVATGHRRLPRELRGGGEPPHGFEHRLRTASEHVPFRWDQLGDESRLDAHFGIRHERGRLRVPIAAKPEHRLRPPQLLRQVRERRDSDAASHQERPLYVEAETVSEGPEDRERVSRLERGERARAGADD